MQPAPQPCALRNPAAAAQPGVPCRRLLAGLGAWALWLPTGLSSAAQEGGAPPSAPQSPDAELAPPPAPQPSFPKPLWVQAGTAINGGFGLGVVMGPDLSGDQIPECLVSAFGGEQPGLHSLDGRRGTELLFVPPMESDLEFGFALALGADRDLDGHGDYWVGVRGAMMGNQRPGEVRQISSQSGEVLRRFAAPAGAQHYGTTLALIDDLNGNGTPELVIGAPGEERSRGAVYLLDSSNGTLIERLAGSREGDRYGSCLLVLPDQNGDKIQDLAIGVPGDSGRGLNFGAVRVLSGSTRRALRSFFGDETGCEFGASLAVGPDATGDGYPEILIGQPSRNQSSTPDHGRVQLCAIGSGTVLSTWDGSHPGDFYGTALCGGFDWNRDGSNDFAVGIPWAQMGPGGADKARPGRVEVRSGSTGQLLALLEAPESARLFGFTMALGPDRQHLLIGAPGRPPLKFTEEDPSADEAPKLSITKRNADKKLPKGHVALYRLPEP